MNNGKAAVAYSSEQIEWRPVAQLVPSAKNVRQHDQPHVDQLMASIRKWGWTIPILVDENNEIIAGHGRVLAAQQLAIGEVPVLVAAGWSKQQKLAYAIADNKLTENGSWDEEMLRTEILALLQDGQEELVHLTGFSELEIQNIVAEETDPYKEWQGMPEFDQPDGVFRTIALHFKTETAIADFAKLVGQDINTTTRYLWFPEEKWDDALSRHYAADENGDDDSEENEFGKDDEDENGHDDDEPEDK